MELTYIIKAQDTYKNVKDVLIKHFKISHRLLTKLKRQNCIYKNDIKCFVNDNVLINDKISVSFNYSEENNIVPINIPIDIIYEDESLLIVNKPYNMPVHPSHSHYTDSLSNGISYYFNSIKLYKKIRPVNRIDKDTSGIVVFAKNEYIQECLISQMKEHIFQKEYIAICDGILEGSGIIDAPIARKAESIIEREININGEKAVTHYNILATSIKHNFSVIQCKLETGKTHQIRLHMKHIGYPLLGDSLYGVPSSFINRQALHSYKIEFIHPISLENITCIAPLPNDIENCVNFIPNFSI